MSRRDRYNREKERGRGREREKERDMYKYIDRERDRDELDRYVLQNICLNLTFFLNTLPINIPVLGT